MSDGKFKPGQSGNPKGRPKGVLDRRQRLQQTIRDGIEPVIAMLQARAAEGDVQAAGLLLSRGIAPLRAESDDRVQFEFDASKPLSDQLAAIAQAAADGSISLEQAHQFTEIAKALATVRAMEGGGEDDKTTRLVNAMKDFAQGLTASGKA